jgi:glucose/arabinose dehydrogenase
LSAFLDIQINRTEGSIELSQPGLIDKVIRYTGMQDCNTGENTPASVTPFRTDSGGEPWVNANENREYAAALGMLMYLVKHTRPDIAFAVNQCARFSFGPKLTHAKAIKRIVRYLQATRTRDMVFSPTGEITVDTYVDADFAGLWAVEHEPDPVCSKSRTGCLLELAGCPNTWTSKQQTESALPTMELEYIALSQAMRELIPL